MAVESLFNINVGHIVKPFLKNNNNKTEKSKPKEYPTNQQQQQTTRNKISQRHKKPGQSRILREPTPTHFNTRPLTGQSALVCSWDPADRSMYMHTPRLCHNWDREARMASVTHSIPCLRGGWREDLVWEGWWQPLCPICLGTGSSGWPGESSILESDFVSCFPDIYPLGPVWIHMTQKGPLTLTGRYHCHGSRMVTSFLMECHHWAAVATG